MGPLLWGHQAGGVTVTPPRYFPHCWPRWKKLSSRRGRTGTHQSSPRRRFGLSPFHARSRLSLQRRYSPFGVFGSPPASVYLLPMGPSRCGEQLFRKVRPERPGGCFRNPPGSFASSVFQHFLGCSLWFDR